VKTPNTKYKVHADTQGSPASPGPADTNARAHSHAHNPDTDPEILCERRCIPEIIFMVYDRVENKGFLLLQQRTPDPGHKAPASAHGVI
jgi:hypothetical protein